MRQRPETHSIVDLCRITLSYTVAFSAHSHAQHTKQQGAKSLPNDLPQCTSSDFAWGDLVSSLSHRKNVLIRLWWNHTMTSFLFPLLQWWPQRYWFRVLVWPLVSSLQRSMVKAFLPRPTPAQTSPLPLKEWRESGKKRKDFHLTSNVPLEVSLGAGWPQWVSFKHGQLSTRNPAVLTRYWRKITETIFITEASMLQFP